MIGPGSATRFTAGQRIGPVSVALVATGAVIGAILTGCAGSAVTTPSPEPTSTRTDGAPAIDLATSQTFAMRDGAATVVNGVRIATTGAGENSAAFTVSGDGFEPITVVGPLGQVVEVPGWGLLVAESVDVTPVGGSTGDEPGLPRPEGVVSYRTDVREPLEFETEFTVAGGALTPAAVDGLRLRVGSVAGSGTSLRAEVEIIDLDGEHGEGWQTLAVGDVVDVDGWGSLTVVVIDTAESAADGDAAGEVRFRAGTRHMPQIDRDTAVG